MKGKGKAIYGHAVGVMNRRQALQGVSPGLGVGLAGDKGQAPCAGFKVQALAT